MHGGGGGAGPGFGGLGPNEPKDPWEVKKNDSYLCPSICLYFPTTSNYLETSHITLLEATVTMRQD